MKRKNKKSLKGITLAEVIVSLAVVSILSLLLVKTTESINRVTRSSNTINKKVSVQAPIAEIKDTAASKGKNGATGAPIDDNMKVVITISKDEGKVQTEGESGMKHSQVGVSGEINGKVYSVDDPETMLTPGANSSENVLRPGGSSLNMKFVVLENIDPTTASLEPTTPSEPEPTEPSEPTTE